VVARPDHAEAVAHHQTVHLFQKPDESLDDFLVRVGEARTTCPDAVGHPRIDASLRSATPAGENRQRIIDKIQSMLPPDCHLELISDDLDDLDTEDEFEIDEEE